MDDTLSALQEEIQHVGSTGQNDQEEARGSMSTLSGMALSPVDYIVNRLDSDPNYIKYLLVVRPYVMSALTYPPHPYDEEARLEMYSSAIGSPLHCDVIELNTWLETLSQEDNRLLFSWAEKQGAKPAFGAARIRRVDRLVADWNKRR
jgi:hypothetical protein